MPQPIPLLSINHPLSVIRPGSVVPCRPGLSLRETRGAPSGETSGHARCTSRIPRRHRWPARRTGTDGPPGTRSRGSSRLSPPYGRLTSSSPGKVPCAERRPSGYSRYSGNRRLCFPPGCPVAFHWPGRPGLCFRRSLPPPLRVFRVILLPVQARPAPNPLQHGPGFVISARALAGVRGNASRDVFSCSGADPCRDPSRLRHGPEFHHSSRFLRWTATK